MTIEELVRRDLLHREKTGFGGPGYTGRAAILDAYDAVLDTACYLRQMIEDLTVGGGKPDRPTVEQQPPLPPHFRAARGHAENECGWFCQHRPDPGE